MLSINDLEVQKELDPKAMEECRGGRYYDNGEADDGLHYGGGTTVMQKLEEWAYYKFWY